jgi:two-component system sensor histidine kinase TrcS
LARETVIVIVLVLLALLGTAAGTVWIVSYALRPLRRVAEVAGEVAALPLTSQEHRITARVAESDTDPGNEVGIGNTLNRLLANVDGALADLAASIGGCGSSWPTPATNCAPRWRRSWDTPS